MNVLRTSQDVWSDPHSILKLLQLHGLEDWPRLVSCILGLCEAVISPPFSPPMHIYFPLAFLLPPEADGRMPARHEAKDGRADISIIPREALTGSNILLPQEELACVKSTLNIFLSFFHLKKRVLFSANKTSPT